MSQLVLLLGFAKHELRQGWRSAEFWTALVFAAIATAVPCAQSGTTAALAGYVAGQSAVTVLGFLGMIWFSIAACRDIITQAEQLILSKPSTGESIVLGRFLGNYGVVLLLLIGELVAGAFAQTVFAKTPLAPMAYWHAFERSLVPLFFLGTLAYSLSLLFGTPVTGLLAITYWVSVLSGGTYLQHVFNCALTQNASIYLCIGLGVLTLTAVLYHPKRRGAQQFPTGWAAVTAALFIVGGLMGVRNALTVGDYPFTGLPLAEAMRTQHIVPGQRAPGFWLPDQWGGTSRLEQFHGKVLVIGLWTPGEPGAVDVLNTLARVRQEFPKDEVAPIAIGISDDHAVPRHVGLDSGFDFPSVADTGGRAIPPYDHWSPLASAYNATSLPVLVITDRRRMVVYVRRDFSPANAEEAMSKLTELVAQQF